MKCCVCPLPAEYETVHEGGDPALNPMCIDHAREVRRILTSGRYPTLRLVSVAP